MNADIKLNVKLLAAKIYRQTSLKNHNTKVSVRECVMVGLLPVCDVVFEVLV